MSCLSRHGAIVRVGDTVRRPAKPSSASVQAVLAHLRRAGLTCIPEPMGFDDLGRDVVGYIAGEVWNDVIPEVAWRSSTLMTAGRLLRELHDATVDFEPPSDACWMLEMPSDLPVEVVCHNDFAVYNAVFRGDRLEAVIDWETAAPGARVWDLAYAAYRFVPLSLSAPAELCEARVQAQRLASFCDAYGAGRSDRALLLSTVARRIEAIRLLVERALLGGSAVDARVWQEHAELYAADEAYLQASASVLAAGL
jgi:aminoglycoside phosphotransferase (APT) family kinase protein